MLIQVAGSGCPKCRALEANVKDACAQLSMDAEIQHLFNPKDYMQFGVIITPAVIVDGEVLVSGHVADVQELKDKIAAFQKENDTK